MTLLEFINQNAFGCFLLAVILVPTICTMLMKMVNPCSGCKCCKKEEDEDDC